MARPPLLFQGGEFNSVAASPRYAFVAIPRFSSRPLYYFTVRATVVERTSVPLVPVIVRIDVPVPAAPLFVVTLKVEDEPKLAVAPFGNPLTLKPTLPVNPPEDVTDTA